MKILAMDTAANPGGVALLEEGRLLAAASLEAPSGHVVALPMAVERLLAAQNWRVQELGLLVVTLGPGSFTGVRIALGLAKGMGLAHGLPVVGITSLELIAAGAGVSGLVAAVLDARRAEIFAAIYRVGPDQTLETLLAPEVWSPEGFADHLVAMTEPVRCTGPGLAPYGALFQERLGPGYLATAPECWQADPALLGQLGWRRWLHTGGDGVALEPLYLRRAEAERNRLALEGHV